MSSPWCNPTCRAPPDRLWWWCSRDPAEIKDQIANLFSLSLRYLHYLSLSFHYLNVIFIIIHYLFIIFHYLCDVKIKVGWFFLEKRANTKLSRTSLMNSKYVENYTIVAWRLMKIQNKGWLIKDGRNKIIRRVSIKDHLMRLRDVSHRSVECTIREIAHVYGAPLAGRYSYFSACMNNLSFRKVSSLARYFVQFCIRNLSWCVSNYWKIA